MTNKSHDMSLNDVAGYSPEDEIDWIVKNAKKKEEWIPIIVGPCMVV